MTDVRPLITCAELRRLRDDPSLVLFDVRWRLGGPPPAADYVRCHIPGASYLNLDNDLAAAPGPGGRGGRHPLPEAAAFQEVMRRARVNSGSQVVVYDDTDSAAAARAWWVLRYFGHERVRVLQGGLTAWVAGGYPCDTGGGQTVSANSVLADGQPKLHWRSGEELGDFTARPGGMPLLDADAAGALARTGILLDARAGERYRGETEPVDPVAGHIPGAVSAPTAGNLTGYGEFRPAADLAARFAALGITDGTEVGVYCGSGVTAAHEILALTVAGVQGAALYAGSWSDWITNPARPIATGPEAG